MELLMIGWLLALQLNIILALKVARDKHSSLFRVEVTDDEIIINRRA
jgi:hypothetical protein